ncbi:MAG TPA: Ni/Fe-hydrogenase cytochrome b subunit, partial [Bacteroidetes bacterium]|nr:Ni/Fe-hydrogenase cytochrome b subunit [Bacteroidota bacterium]
MKMNRVRNFKLILWMILGLGAAVATARFMFGLGVTTNLSDRTPWGLWIGFDVMSGVALAAGGFVLTATVYIFKLDRFHSIVRPAVLTAFLGYAAVAVGLLFDLGLPWNIWHMIIFWNPHSALFEVGWCVMLYLTVLLLEFFPVPAEEFGFLSKIRNFLIRLRLPLVIAGIALSTLHQSSLGSLFLIMPYNLHPLWYSPILPVVFFISAIGLGLMMVTFESLFTAWLYRRKPEMELLERLGAAARWVFLLYLAVRLGDLAVRGQLVHLGGCEWQVGMFWVELAIAVVIPTVLLFIRAVRRSPAGLMTVAITSVTGIVLNRINVGGLVHINRGDTLYLPAWTEIAITSAVIAGAAVVFLFMVEKFNVWERRPADPDAEPTRKPKFHPVDGSWLGEPGIA